MGCHTKDMRIFFVDSHYHMADISGKIPSFRRAVAMGRITVGKTAFAAIKERTLPKGDALKLAEIAGINGTKEASRLLPLCHPMMLDHVAVHMELEPDTDSIAVYCLVVTTAKTGVEMEALAGVNAALLTLYDLTKPVEPALTISDIRLLLKEGGKKGLWVHPEGIPDNLKEFLPQDSKRPLEGMKAAVITLSDRASSGEYEDKSGKLMCEILQQLGAEITKYDVLPDNKEQLANSLKDLAKRASLIMTTGGTGLAPRDVTPETILALCNRTVPGIGELLRQSGAHHLPQAWLSRSVAGVIGDALVIALPGSPNAVKEGMDALKTILPHALELMTGKHAQCHTHGKKRKAS